MQTIVIVGASLAGLSAARTLRAEGFDGDLVAVGAEAHRPYDRPPLSKQVLAGEWKAEETTLLAADEELAVRWRLGERVTGLDLIERRCELAGGGEQRFDGLVIATGAKPRALPGPPLGGVHALRTLADCGALAADLEAAGRVVVIGGGFIGAEVAATCRRRGLEVTVVEPLPGLLWRQVGAGVAATMAELHRANGVELRLGEGVEELIGRAGRVRGVRLGSGDVLAADAVVVAIGVEPEVDWLAGSGLRLDDGVLCDETCLAAPSVVAAGDVARWPNHRTGETRRIEHWDNAVRQGAHAATRLLAGDGAVGREPYAPVPWVWSDQYEHKLQIAGSTFAHDEARTVHRDEGGVRGVTIYRRGDRLAGVLAIGQARRLLRYRALIESGASWEDAVALAAAAA